MTKRETWLFAVFGTGICAVAFLGMTVHSHMRFPELTNTENLTPEVHRGMEVWHDENCINCHTLMGEGAYYAPDLTEITKQRGDEYLKAFLKNPSEFYSEDDYARVMPDPDVTDEEIDELIAFLEWVAEIDKQGWPPRPIRVTGGSLERSPAAESPADDPAAKGRAIFNGPEAACNSCHSTEAGETLAGPSMAGLATRAAETIEEGRYDGEADSAEAYIRESILEPNAHIVEGKNFASDGTSMMPADYSERLSDQQLDHLVAYLMTLE